jgi:cytidylate kinase
MPLVSSIAIDGPAGSGKSTIAKLLSAATGLPYLSTGEMYRAIALCAIREGIDVNDADAVSGCAVRAKLGAVPDGRGGFRIKCGHEDVTDQLRSVQVGRLSSSVAVHPSVRMLMVQLQRAIAEKTDVIMDGRDIGTVVLKESLNKIYLDASAEVRARRRLMDYKELGLIYEEVLKDIEERDMRDSTRITDPLRPAEGALIIDTSSLSPTEVVEMILRHVSGKTGV